MARVKKAKKNSMMREAWRRLKKNPRAMVALCFLVFFFLVAAFADVIADYQMEAVKQVPLDRLQGPSAEHWFGTDNYGRDIFARIVHGTRIAILYGFGATLIGIVIGSLVGTASAYFGGRVDDVIMRIVDVMSTIPTLLLALAIVAGLGSGLPQVVIELAVGQIPNFVRVVRSAALSVVNMEYLEAGKALGANHLWLISKYVIPNVISIILIQGAMNVSFNLLMGATLSFVGLGVQVPTPEWGYMLKEGLSFMEGYPHLVVIPGICLMLVALAINTFGDCLRDALDPRLKGKA